MVSCTYQVPGGAHQLVGGEGEGLIAQVCVEHLLENGPAVRKSTVSQSVSQQTFAKHSWMWALGWEALGMQRRRAGQVPILTGQTPSTHDIHKRAPR